MAKCPNCGRELSEQANFCDKCGASLQSQSPAIAQMIDDARQALFSNPDDVSARYNLAIAYKLGGMDDLALEELSRVAELQPDFVDVHYELGLLHAKSGRTEEAIGALNRAVGLDPEHRRAGRLLERLRGRG
jgi:tetratricopeptide (TPR) repeat protein